MTNIFIAIITIFFLTMPAIALTTLQHGTEKYFESIKTNPIKLALFLKKMPKGGDLHNHLSGASMAENLINYAKNDHLCVDRKNYNVYVDPHCLAANLLSNALNDLKFYDNIIDAWSMRHFHANHESGHDHFFATFNKYSLISSKHMDKVLSEVVNRAGEQNELYMELMLTPDNNESGKLGMITGWDSDLARLRKKLLSNGLKLIVKNISKKLRENESILNTSLHCRTKQAQPGCHVTVRYLYQILREQPHAQVYAQLLTGFEVASNDSRVVGINMVQPEDGKISLSDYSLHMSMIAFLHGLYPNVRISLHAGELIPGLVSSNFLHSHIRNAIEIAQAARIGHGVDILYEDNAKQLLLEMAKKHVMVEINLSSNAIILGVTGKNHPLTFYLRHDVPVSLSTDDEGVLRTNLTDQYKNAVLTYKFSYATVKKLVRNSIAYSFLPGDSLWCDYEYHRIVPSCEKNTLGSNAITTMCQKFLNSNEKAKLQWKLEKKFIKFEKSFSR